jgi:hypothetical protein
MGIMRALADLAQDDPALRPRVVALIEDLTREAARW